MNHSGGDATGVAPFVIQNQHASSFRLSPNRKYLSCMEKDGLKKHVYIKEIETGEVMRVIEEKPDGLLQLHAGLPGEIPEITEE